MSSSETDKSLEVHKLEAVAESSISEGKTSSPKSDRTPSDNPHAPVSTKDNSTTTEGADRTQKQKRQKHNKPRKLYQALARIEGSLKTKDDALVLITKGDKAELEVVKIAGQYTAVRLLKRPANRRQGIYSLYPLEKGYKVVTYLDKPEDKRGPYVPLNDQMFICGRLVGREESAFLVDIGRYKRTHKGKKQIEIPLRVEGREADAKWSIGQWIGLVLHREGSKWLWKGEHREVLKGVLPFKDRDGNISGA